VIDKAQGRNKSPEVIENEDDFDWDDNDEYI
jgi:hypothetical protein